MSKFIALIALLVALTATLAPAPAAAAPPAASAPPVFTATAWVSDATPVPDRLEIVGGRLLLAGKPVAGAGMLVTWTTKTGTSTCTGVTGANGIASCSHAIGHPAVGVAVAVTVVFVQNGQVRAMTTTRFTPRSLPVAHTVANHTVASPAVTAYTVSAWVSDATPGPNRPETVSGRLLLAGKPVAGAGMLVTWTSTAGTSSCTAVTGANGSAACSRAIGYPAVGAPVRVTVVFVRDGQVRSTTTTRFTPREGGRG